MRKDTTQSTRTFMAPAASTEPPAKSKRRPAPFKQRNLLLVIIIVLTASCIFLFVQYQQAEKKLNGESQQATEQLQKLKTMILLPEDETPTVVQVKDVSKLKSQQFYVNAKNGDTTYIYPKLQKAILYRASTNMIINVAPVKTNPN